MWCTANPPYTLGMVGMQDLCSYSNSNSWFTSSTSLCSGASPTWTNSFAYCKAGYVACGYTWNEYVPQSDGVAFGAVDLKFACCKICDVSEGFFYNTGTNTCDFCDVSCLTCSGSPTFCTSCPSSYSLSGSNACISSTPTQIVTQELFTIYALSVGWTSDVSLSLQNSCGPFTFVGGYNGLGSSDWLQKSFTTLPGHFMIRVSFQYYKIGDYNGANVFKVDVDGNLITSFSYAPISLPIYTGYGANCGGSNLLMKSKRIDFTISHVSSSATIKMQISSTIGFWAVNNFLVVVFSCDSTCQTCTGVASNQCTSCFANTYLTASSTCPTQCPTPLFGDPTTWTCVAICLSTYYGDPTTQDCVLTCPYPYYKNSGNSLCELPCSGGLYGDSVSGFCVSNCPNGYYALDVSFTCTSQCPTPFFEDSTTWTCVATCPSPYYGDPTTQDCVLKCPDNYYENNGNSLCEMACSGGLYGDPLNGFCVASCPDGYWGDTTSGLCQFCEFNCKTCTGSSTNCLSCKYYWLGGTSSCSDPAYTQNVETVFNLPTLSHADVLVSKWTIENELTSNDVTTCGDYILVGGSGVFGTNAAMLRSFSGLKPHLFGRLTFYFMKIGNWNSNNLLVEVNGNIILTKFFSFLDEFPFQVCAPPDFTSSLQQIDVYFNHSSTTLDLKISTDLQLDATQASWGIKDLTLSIYLCHSSCNLCSTVNSPNSCLSCSSGLYLQASMCVSSCLPHLFGNNFTNTCEICDISCLECIGPSPNQCISCATDPSGTFLESNPPSNCVCQYGFYFDSSSISCQECDSACQNCIGNGRSNCVSCKDGYFLFASNHTCLPCDSSCLKCSENGTDGCTACVPGLFLANFSGPSFCNKTCPSGTYGDKSRNTCLQCDTSCLDCVNNSNSSCLSCHNAYILQNIRDFNKQTIGNCVPRNQIKSLLKNDSYPLNYLLIFESSYSDIYALYQNQTRITIDGISNTTYNFTLTHLSETEIWFIKMDLNFSITDYPLMRVDLNPPESILSEFPLIQLTNYTLFTNMQYYYYIDPETLRIINYTTETSNNLAAISSNSYIANNLLAFTSNLIFETMIVADMIKLLGFLNISYPENVLSIFQSNSPLGNFIPDVYIQEDEDNCELPKNFLDYSVSPYIFNNVGNYIIEGIFYWLMGVILLCFVKFMRNSKSKLKTIKALKILFSIVFVWTYSLSYFLSNFIFFVFYTFVSYKYPIYESSKDKMNLLLSIFLGIVFVSLFPIFFMKIKRISKEKTEKMKAVNVNDEAILYAKEASKEAQILSQNLKKFTENPLKIKKNLIQTNLNKLIQTISSFIGPPKENTVIPIANNTPTSAPKTERNSPIIHRLPLKQMTTYEKFIEGLNKIIPEMIEETNFRERKKHQNPKISFEEINSPISISKPSQLQKKEGCLADESTRILKSLPNMKEKSNSIIELISEESENKNVLLEAKRYSILHKNYQKRNFLQVYFIIVSLSRDFIYSMTIPLLFDQPIKALFICISLEGIFNLTILFVRPFKEKKTLYVTFIYEACLNVAIICSIYIAYIDGNSIKDEELKIKLGWGIVFANILIQFVFLLTMLITWLKIFYLLLKELVWRIQRRLYSKNQVFPEKSEAIVHKDILDKIIELENAFR